MILSHKLKFLAGVVVPLSKSANAACPIAGGRNLRSHGIPASSVGLRTLAARAGDGGVPDAGYDAVKQDIDDILRISQDFFPADFAPNSNYGPLMIRLAWHCSGSYRSSDGRGGCDGGRIRFDPELNWPDNANLDKALKILEPIKEKYGSDLSWGDLIILAGNTAIESMGGPVLGFCGGRIDDTDGSNSLILGPSDEQEELTPCLDDDLQGQCPGNLGPTTVGLIYVNPAGHLGDPDPEGLIISDIRSTFGNMGMNDTETLALIGGGHSFGKCHGACASPPCGTGNEVGKGRNTFTSGFEGPWTTAPTEWTNQYFTNLFEYSWTLLETGPGGNPQWAPKEKNGSDGPDIMMLTSDIALLKDNEFTKISRSFAKRSNGIDVLGEQFMHAWYKLTTSDMGPVTRCLGDNIPPAQLFQTPLPPASDALVDFKGVREQIQVLIDGDAENRGAFIDLAYKCGSTFRVTNYQGGCNGAFIRFEEDYKDVIDTLATIKDHFHDASFADIIVLAGQVSAEDAGSNAMHFCGGRTDASDSSGRDRLEPVTYDSRLTTVVKVRDALSIQGLTARQGVALAGRPTGSSEMDNEFFVDLMEAHDSGDKGSFTDEEWALVEDDELNAIVKLYAEVESEFLSEFADAWTYLMTADRFDGPRKNACSGVSTLTLATGLMA